MKIELFLEKLNTDNRILSATKEKYGYVVTLKEGYMFAEMNYNSIRMTNQKEILEFVDDIVERSKEEVVRVAKINDLKSEIKRNKEWRYNENRMRECEKTIEYNNSQIKNYERSIKNCKKYREEAESSIEYYKKEIAIENKKLSELEKQLKEMEGGN